MDLSLLGPKAWVLAVMLPPCWPAGLLALADCSDLVGMLLETELHNKSIPAGVMSTSSAIGLGHYLSIGIRGQSVALSLGSSVGLQLLLTPGLFPLNDCTLTTD